MDMRHGLFVWTILFSLPAPAEYRVYKMKLLERGKPVDAAPIKEIISSLDPDQYRGYHLIPENQVLVISQHWLCSGRTGPEIPVCPAPKVISPSDSPARAVSSEEDSSAKP